MSDNMPSATAGWFGEAGGNTHARMLHGAQPPLPSPQYGPAWVADCYGSTDAERLEAIATHLNTDAPLAAVMSSGDGNEGSADDVARAYFRMVNDLPVILDPSVDAGDAGEVFEDGCS